MSEVLSYVRFTSGVGGVQEDSNDAQGLAGAERWIWKSSSVVGGKIKEFCKPIKLSLSMSMSVRVSVLSADNSAWNIDDDGMNRSPSSCSYANFHDSQSFESSFVRSSISDGQSNRRDTLDINVEPVYNTRSLWSFAMLLTYNDSCTSPTNAILKP
jgi:hypothetical protein